MSTKKDEKKILMIDDSDAALEIMELYVESEFENPIITAANGNEAIEILKKTSNISVIICDYNMPQGDGGDVFQYVTQNCPSIPFILVCGEDAQTIKTLPKLEGLLDNKKVLQNLIHDKKKCDYRVNNNIYFRILNYLIWNKNLKEYGYF